MSFGLLQPGLTVNFAGAPGAGLVGLVVPVSLLACSSVASATMLSTLLTLPGIPPLAWRGAVGEWCELWPPLPQLPSLDTRRPMLTTSFKAVRAGKG